MIELLVAVLILSIATLAAFRAFGSGAETAAALRTRTLAEMVALNRAAELRLGEAPQEGEAEFGGRSWQVRTEAEATEAGFAATRIAVSPGGVRLTVWLDPEAGE